MSNFKPLDSESTPSPVSNQKSAIYNVHGHYAKRPFNVVSHCIDYFTKEGDIVLGPFSGFGVTGIEALRLKRKTVIADINPVSVFITKSVLDPIPPNKIAELDDTLPKLRDKISGEMAPLYKTRCSVCGRKATIRSTIYNSENDADDPRERVWKPISVMYDCVKHPRRRKRPGRTDVALVKHIEGVSLEH